MKQNNIKRNLKLKKQQGFGIMTVILGIVASAIIIVIGFQAYNHAMLKIKIGQAQKEIQDISTGIDSLYANSHDFSRITTQGVIDAGIVDQSYVVGSNIVSPWYSRDTESTITVTPASQPTSYIINITMIPTKVCSSLFSMFLNNNRNTVTVATTIVTDPASLAKACGASQYEYMGLISISF